ncbi:HEAT repeat domain-containing protein [Curtobacterium flaccumfaciens pv. flaccumfaciens]|uniref:HEAT repeat domain-containing protein n=1 Tax=Curtobacterium flaccumfaciens TaxID=2035 RepID=UPI001ADC8B5D|nr:HEAT repeat domain-containing protein [Curtobacterium flaccumfaciens]MBO9045807.1 HEAT repeat domain-containing protein [Curtobacterium flaccumfaciens pv. flaccumfaciens]QTR91022.1 HEAT repeat domain-containing protein [Curtobacterium flaccumfaciens pv. flaccumfaciens]
MPFTAEEAAEQSAILADLRALGYDFSSLSAFAQSGIRYEDAVPTLLEWLRKVRTPMMQRAVARTLTNPSAKGAAMPALVDAFRNFTDEAGTRWAVGNSIETAYVDTYFDDVAALALDPRYGRARQMVALALGKSKRPEAVDVLLQLMDDHDISGHAVFALSTRSNPQAREALEEKLTDDRPWVRKKAALGLRKIG